jgi:hypothetical protein
VAVGLGGTEPGGGARQPFSTAGPGPTASGCRSSTTTARADAVGGGSGFASSCSPALSMLDPDARIWKAGHRRWLTVVVRLYEPPLRQCRRADPFRLRFLLFTPGSKACQGKSGGKQTKRKENTAKRKTDPGQGQEERPTLNPRRPSCASCVSTTRQPRKASPATMVPGLAANRAALAA